MTELRYHAHSAANPDTVWAVLVSHQQMAEWMPFVWRSRLVEHGHTEPNGIGAVRAAFTLGGPVREEITDFDRPQRLRYRMTRGNGLIQNYRATVELTAGTQGGTDIEWTLSFIPRPRWLAPVINRLVVINTQGFAWGLAGAAEDHPTNPDLHE